MLWKKRIVEVFLQCLLFFLLCVCSLPFPWFQPPTHCTTGGHKRNYHPLFSHWACCRIWGCWFFLQMNIIHTMHSSLNGHFFGSYSFNLFYLFILVMRNNIMIVNPSFFGVDLSFWLQGIYELIHKTDTQLQAIYYLFLNFCLRFQL